MTSPIPTLLDDSSVIGMQIVLSHSHRRVVATHRTAKEAELESRDDHLAVAHLEGPQEERLGGDAAPAHPVRARHAGADPVETVDRVDDAILAEVRNEGPVEALSVLMAPLVMRVRSLARKVHDEEDVVTAGHGVVL